MKFPFRDNPKGRIEFIFQHETNPCPKCGSYNLKYQTPIDLRDKTHEKLLGIAYIVCWDCKHKSPSIDVSHMTRSTVGQSSELGTKLVEVWNSQVLETKSDV